MIKIDKEFESLIPPLSDDEFQQLEENCVKEGIRDALVVWKVPNGDQILIDGHNRWKIAAKHGGIPFQIKEMKFDLREDAKAWIIRNQIGRRNIDKWVKFDLQKLLEPIEKAEAKKRQGTRTDITPTLAESEKGETRDKMAKQIGVSHGTYQKMKAIDDSNDEMVKQAVRSGDMSINQGYREIKGLNRTNKQAQKELIDSVKQERDEFKEQKENGVVSFGDAVRDKENAEFLAQELYRRCMRLGSQIDTFCMEVKEKEVNLSEELKPLPLADKQRLQWQFRNWGYKLLQLIGEMNK
jgi:hypothetical protein